MGKHPNNFIVRPKPDATNPAHATGHTRLELDAETMAALRELGDAILVVRRRLLSEGYVIQNGRYVAPTKRR